MDGGISSPSAFAVFRIACRLCCLLCRKADARQIGPYHDIAGETACLGRFAVIHFGQGTARNLPGALALRSDRRAQMREHEILCSYPLRHCAEIGSLAL